MGVENPHMYHIDPKQGIFCKQRNPTFTNRAAWTTIRVVDWNYANEQLKDYNQSKWHRNNVINAEIAK